MASSNSKRWQTETDVLNVAIGSYVRTVFGDDDKWTLCKVVDRPMRGRGTHRKMVLEAETADGDTTYLDTAVDMFEVYKGDGVPTDADEVIVQQTEVDIDKLEQELRKRLGDVFDLEALTDKILKKTGGYKGVEIKQGKVTIAKIEGRVHHMFEAVLERVQMGFINFLLVGPAGSGKTTLVSHIAKALKLEFAAQTFTAGTPESVLVGKMIPNIAKGTDEYRPSVFVKMYEKGGVYLGDEIDAMDANFGLQLNTALDNGFMVLPNGKVITRSPKFYFFGNGNTFGHGATQMYVGRNQLDAATLDRFVGATFHLDYDRELETLLIGKSEQAQTALRRLWACRDRAAQVPMRRVVSTRAVIATGKMLVAGMAVNDALKAVFLGWSREELHQVGEPNLYSGI